MRTQRGPATCLCCCFLACSARSEAQMGMSLTSGPRAGEGAFQEARTGMQLGCGSMSSPAFTPPAGAPMHARRLARVGMWQQHMRRVREHGVHRRRACGCCGRLLQACSSTCSTGARSTCWSPWSARAAASSTRCRVRERRRGGEDGGAAVCWRRMMRWMGATQSDSHARTTRGAYCGKACVPLTQAGLLVN